MIIILKLLLWFVPIGINVWADAKGRKPVYAMMFCLRGGVAILYQFLMVPVEMMPWTLGWWQFLMILAPIFFYQVTSFWIFFELSLNIIQKRGNLLYYDRKENDSGWIDEFFAWAGPTWHAVAKAAALIVMILSIIVIYNNYGAV